MVVLQDALNLGFLLLELVHVFLFKSCLLDLLLSFILFLDSFIDHVSLLFEHADSVDEVHVLEVAARLGALVVETSFLVAFVSFLSISEPIVEHVDSDEVSHFGVHFFSLAQLEGEVLILVVLVKGFGIILEEFKEEVSRVAHHTGVDSHQTQLLATINYPVSRADIFFVRVVRVPDQHRRIFVVRVICFVLVVEVQVSFDSMKLLLAWISLQLAAFFAISILRHHH